MPALGGGRLFSLSWCSSLARITTATVRPISAISATESSARSWLKCDRRTTAGCWVGTAWPMCASCPWAAAGAARPVLVVMTDIDGDHGRGRLQKGQGAITGWKTAIWPCPGAAVRWGSRLAWLFAWSSASSVRSRSSTRAADWRSEGVSRGHGYQLMLDPERLDAHRFERLVAAGRSEMAVERPERAVVALEEGLSLWRGRPLDDLAYEPFAQRASARLDDMRVAATEELVEARLALGRHADVLAELEPLIADQPYRERLRAQLMLALYRCDRQAEALQAYQEARRTLVEGLGIEPGERLRELERAILAQDAALAAPAAPPSGDHGEAALLPAELPTGVVTFLLTDIEGSSGLWEADAGAMAAALELHDELIAAAVGAHAGRLLKAKGEGDSTLTVFRRASDAVACAVEIQGALRHAPWPGGLDLRARVALHTGEAHERGGDYFGPALNRAARLRSLARGGVTVVSQATAEIVCERMPPGTELVERGRQELLGLSRPENVFELRAT